MDKSFLVKMSLSLAAVVGVVMLGQYSTGHKDKPEAAQAKDTKKEAAQSDKPHVVAKAADSSKANQSNKAGKVSQPSSDGDVFK